ncbi:FAD/NAD(P)-binding protein [Algoriphagus sp. AGSA1]|uniref:FAD/NAD(P)-binding protein n=1 Tax=Algoriphagus sp. AGSA1 TaxID=2907213 RepID=UPI001F173D66|nr:FAD/NAD(P)-binding protein [Algoriphagus sp. AGSA1]
MPEENPAKIAFIGFGPKGLYGLERLLANLALKKNAFPIELHLFNKSDSFGAGDIYNPKQPLYLLMNYSNGHINMWAEKLPAPVVPYPRSFMEWLSGHKDEFPDPIADGFSPRATVGRYLSEGFEQLINSCPDHIKIIRHVGEVKNIEKTGESYRLIYHHRNSGYLRSESNIQNILISTGHPSVNDSEYLSEPNYIDFIYPVTHRLSQIPIGSKVAIKGMGLTFIDAVLGLTEGRNGKFMTKANKVTYVRSGLEPEKIYPFSKSGLLMMPRGSTFGKPSYSPSFFNEDLLKYLDTLDGKHDFERQLLPLIEQEFISVYYSKVFQEHGMNLHLTQDFSEVKFQIDAFLDKHPDIPRFDFHDFLTAPLPKDNLHGNTQDYIRFCIEQAEIGVEKSPFAATADLWRRLSDSFNGLYKFGGLLPQSQKLFLEKYAGQLNRLSYGPPIENMKKIEALADAGLIDFSFSQDPMLLRNDVYTLATDKGKSIHADILIDARIPKVHLHQCAGELFDNMVAQGLISPYVNRQEGRLDYRPGCLAINEKGQPIDESGLANTSLTFYGTPTEGLTYDNDTLSREKNDFVSEWAKDLTENLYKKEEVT